MSETKLVAEVKKDASKAYTFVSSVVSARNIIIGVIAIATAVGSWFRPTDTTATKATYEVLASRVNSLEEAIANNHDDLVALRAYLEGYTKGSAPSEAQAAPVAAVEPKVGDAPVRVAAKVPPKVRVLPTPEPVRASPSPTKLPDLSPVVESKRLPPFEDVLAH